MLRHCAYIATFVPSVLRWRLAETHPGARPTETSVAWVRSSTTRRWLAGSTVNTLIRVITSLFAEIVVIVSLPSERVEIRPELHVRNDAATALLRFWDMACSLSLWSPLPDSSLAGQKHGRTIPLPDIRRPVWPRTIWARCRTGRENPSLARCNQQRIRSTHCNCWPTK